MSETETEQGARGEEDEPGPLQGSATEHQHSFEAGVMGLTHCDAEIGDISIETTTAWDAIAYGGGLLRFGASNATRRFASGSR